MKKLILSIFFTFSAIGVFVLPTSNDFEMVGLKSGSTNPVTLKQTSELLVPLVYRISSHTSDYLLEVDTSDFIEWLGGIRHDKYDVPVNISSGYCRNDAVIKEAIIT